MSHELAIDGIVYISSKRAAEITGYTQDYIGQLARAGKIIAKRVGGLWYVLEDSVFGHKKTADEFVPTPPSPESIKPTVAAEDSALVMFDGKAYASAARASKLTAYHQDYIGQLARSGKILSKQVGSRWYVDIEALKSHKKEKDLLLGAVQASSVGLEKNDSEALVATENIDSRKATLHFNYFNESHPLLPTLREKTSETQHAAIETVTSSNADDEEHVIPIRVIRSEYASPILSKRAEIEEKKAVRIPRKSIFYKGFTAAAFTIVVVVAYNIKPIDVGAVYAKFASNSMTGSAVTSSSTESLRKAANFLFANEVSYERR